MNRTEVSDLLKDLESELIHFKKDEKNMSNLYDCEKNYLELMQKYQAKLFQQVVGEAPQSKNKKNC